MFSARDILESVGVLVFLLVMYLCCTGNEHHSGRSGVQKLRTFVRKMVVFVGAIPCVYSVYKENSWTGLFVCPCTLLLAVVLLVLLAKWERNSNQIYIQTNSPNSNTANNKQQPQPQQQRQQQYRQPNTTNPSPSLFFFIS